MSASPSVTDIQVENVNFPPTVKPPGSTKTLFLGGAGERGLEIGGKFIKFTTIGVYLEDSAVDCLAVKWKGKSAEELTESVEFFRDIVTGEFEKFVRVTMILPLTGQQYSEKVAENCVAIWKALGLYTEAESKALDNFSQVFKDQNFPPGSSILFTISGASLTIGFSKDSTVPEGGSAVIENKLLANSVLESIIGKAGVSPAAKKSLASRLSSLFHQCGENNGKQEEANGCGEKVENVSFPPRVKPPGSTKTLFLGGAGVRGLEIQGKFVKFTAIGVYLEDNAVDCLAVKWKGKSGDELAESVQFFRDIVTGGFEKFVRVTMILPLTGPQYSEKVAENCEAIWKSLGIYTDAEKNAIENFIQVFKDKTFPPGSSILFTISDASLTIGFSKDSSVPEGVSAVIENKLLANSVLESIIGKDGVSPAAKKSLASRLSSLFN